MMDHQVGSRKGSLCPPCSMCRLQLGFALLWLNLIFLSDQCEEGPEWGITRARGGACWAEHGIKRTSLSLPAQFVLPLLFSHFLRDQPVLCGEQIKDKSEAGLQLTMWAWVLVGIQKSVELWLTAEFIFVLPSQKLRSPEIANGPTDKRHPAGNQPSTS